MTVRKVTGVTIAQGEPVLFNNLDCTPITYRKAATSVMQTGCFTESAFGLMDTDSGFVIFNGTDEGMPMLPYTPHQVLVPWPHALNVIGLDPADDGGVQISLYKNIFVAFKDQRNLLGQVTGKQLDRPPDIILRDASGKPLIINPQSIAFSEGGAWLVAETLGRSFVRINLATLSVTAFAPAYGSQGSPALFKSRAAITENGRFAVIANDLAAAFKVYDLAACDGAINNLLPQNCRSYEYRPFLQQQVNGLQSVRHVRFVNEGLLSFDAITGDPSTTGMYELAPAGSIASFTDYLGLGDSYTSGEGAFDYLNGTDTEDNSCHVSRNSYPLLLTHDIFTSGGGHSVACSGAIIKDIASTNASYKGQARGVADFQHLEPLLLESVQANFVPGYIAQHRFVQRWQPRIITVSVGGNDIGFGQLLQNCIVPHISRHPSDNTCYNTYEDRVELRSLIDRTMPRWTALYKQLQREAPGMRVYAIGYPQLAADKGSCALNVQLNKSELEFAASMIDYLNQDIRKAAVAAGVPYVDISQALMGHRLCETASHNVAVNGLTAGSDSGVFNFKVFGHESFHPNALGHELIEQAILRQTRNFIDTAPHNPSSSSVDAGATLLNAPLSGRSINTLAPDNNLVSGVAKRGSPLAVHTSGADNGLRSSTAYTVRLDGPGGSVLGILTTSEDGALQGNVNIPADVLAGGHTIDVIGPSQSKDLLDITQPIYVPASDTDMDGDGIDNLADSCPGATNSTQDIDQDRVDDICDSLIGLAPPPGFTGTLSAGTKTIATAAAAHHTNNMPISPRVLSVRQNRPRDHSNPARASVVARSSWWALCAIIPVILLPILLIKRYIQKIKFRLQWWNMSRARKGLIYLLSLFLLATLLGTAVSTSTTQTLGKPKKVEQYLSESKLYDHFIAYTADQAKKTNGDNDQSGSVSLSDAAVQQAAQASFTPKLIEQGVNTFIDSNYAWLEGKTDKPEFKIDLSEQKLTFAQKVGQYVTTYTAGLPVCANDQVALQQSQDPLTATCRPANTTPEQVGAQVTQRISTTGDFLSDPVITAQSVNPKGNTQSKPYYEKLGHLPKAYQLGQKLPYIFAAMSVVWALAIVFASPGRRRGVRKVGIVFLIAGISLVALKFFADIAFRRIENRAFNSASVGQLQQSLTDFAHRLEAAMVRIDLWFGLAFLLIAATIFAVLAATRQKDASKPDAPVNAEPKDDGPDNNTPLVLSRKRLQRPAVKDLTPRARPADDEAPAPQPKPKKPRRLIQ